MSALWGVSLVCLSACLAGWPVFLLISVNNEQILMKLVLKVRTIDRIKLSIAKKKKKTLKGCFQYDFVLKEMFFFFFFCFFFYFFFIYIYIYICTALADQ